MNIKNEIIIPFDVDNTLLLWQEPLLPGPGKLEFTVGSQKVYLTPHNYHIELLKQYVKRGFFIIIWSHNGSEHAEAAKNLLGLKDYVGLTMAKPSKHVDDSINANSIIGPRVFEEDFLKPVYIYIEHGTRGGLNEC